MYDDDEQRRRRTRIIWGIIIGILLLIIIIILLLKACGGSSRTTVVNERDLACKLKVASGTVDEYGRYTSDVVIEFESKTATRDDIPIERFGIGKNKNYSGNETYTLTGVSGKQTINGYVKDSAGNEATCSIDLEVNATVPTCSLKVTDGKLGADDWYTSNVTVGFDTKNPSIDSATIQEFYLSLDQKTFTESSAENPKPTANMDSIIVSKDGTLVVYGYVKDSEGKEGMCEISVKRDTTAPTCTLKVNSGKASNGAYTGNVVVGLNKTTEETSGLDSFGLGTSKNYDKKETFTYTSSATGYVYGYVKDKAGNEGSCRLQIKRNSESGGGTTPTSNPTCSLQISAGIKGNNGWYTSKEVEVSFKAKNSTNGAKITSYGIGTSKSYNGKTKTTVTTDGSIKIYGYVKDSNGKEATCNIIVPKDSTPPTCSLKVLSGTYVSAQKLYTSAVSVQLSAKNDVTSGIDVFGIGTSKAYNNQTSVTVSANGTYTITGAVRDKAGNEAMCRGKITIQLGGSSSGGNQGGITPTTKTLSAAGAKVGDYVVYDAGTWTSTLALTKKANTFSGFTAGRNKGEKVTCEGGSTSKYGWRILSINGNEVKLVSAGITECYYHALNANASSAQTTLLNRGSTYVNTKYATSGTVLTREMISTSMSQFTSYASNDMWNIGAPYYLASASGSNTLWGISVSGTAFYYSQWAYGIRPVVTLKSGIKTSGKGANGWVLVP